MRKVNFEVPKHHQYHHLTMSTPLHGLMKMKFYWDDSWDQRAQSCGVRLDYGISLSEIKSFIVIRESFIGGAIGDIIYEYKWELRDSIHS